MKWEAEDLYLHAVINRHRAFSADQRTDGVRRRIERLLKNWTLGAYLESVTLSGSHAKSTALRDSDVDLFLSLSPDTPGPLAAIHALLAGHFRDYAPLPRNVSLRIQLDGCAVDLVPGRRCGGSTHHTLWQLRHGTWIRTDIGEQIRYVREGGRLTETLALKLWRRRHLLRFPSFLMELCVVRALDAGKDDARISESLVRLLEFLANGFAAARLVDPGNSNNVVSDVITGEEKLRIAAAANRSLRADSWTEILGGAERDGVA